MTGWRLGWALVPDDLLTVFDALAGNFALCPPVPAQHAAVAAFTPASYAEADAAVAEFAEARRVLIERLDDLGWTDVAPADGAFYLYAGLGDRLGGHPDSASWCADLLETTGVALTPGNDFDPVAGGGSVRVSLAAGAAAVATAVERIVEFQQSERDPEGIDQLR
jgi:aspartate/methionine/tyrosine aminotransferase